MARRGWLWVAAGLVVLVLMAGFVALVRAGDDEAAPGAAPSPGRSGPRPMSAAELNSMWTRYAGSPGFHWTGGDRTVSVALPGAITP